MKNTAYNAKLLFNKDVMNGSHTVIEEIKELTKFITDVSAFELADSTLRQFGLNVSHSTIDVFITIPDSAEECKAAINSILALKNKKDLMLELRRPVEGRAGITMTGSDLIYSFSELKVNAILCEEVNSTALNKKQGKPCDAQRFTITFAFKDVDVK